MPQCIYKYPLILYHPEGPGSLPSAFVSLFFLYPGSNIDVHLEGQNHNMCLRLMMSKWGFYPLFSCHACDQFLTTVFHA